MVQGLKAVGGYGAIIAHIPQSLGEEVPDGCLVVHNQDSGRHPPFALDPWGMCMTFFVSRLRQDFSFTLRPERGTPDNLDSPAPESIIHGASPHGPVTSCPASCCHCGPLPPRAPPGNSNPPCSPVPAHRFLPIPSPGLPAPTRHA